MQRCFTTECPQGSVVGAHIRGTLRPPFEPGKKLRRRLEGVNRAAAEQSAETKRVEAVMRAGLHDRWSIAELSQARQKGIGPARAAPEKTGCAALQLSEHADDGATESAAPSGFAFPDVGSALTPDRRTSARCGGNRRRPSKETRRQ